jgi:hypothetical protein
MGVPVDLEALLPAYLVAKVVGVTRQVFNYWRKVGKVVAAGVDKTGRALYRLRDALVVEADTRARSGRRIRPALA